MLLGDQLVTIGTYQVPNYRGVKRYSLTFSGTQVDDRAVIQFSNVRLESLNCAEGNNNQCIGYHWKIEKSDNISLSSSSIKISAGAKNEFYPACSIKGGKGVLKLYYY